MITVTEARLNNDRVGDSIIECLEKVNPNDFRSVAKGISEAMKMIEDFHLDIVNSDRVFDATKKLLEKIS